MYYAAGSRRKQITFMSTDKKIALVTGANRGLGLETARQLAERGCEVLLTSRSERGASVAATLRAAGGAVTFLPLDVARPDSIQSAVRFVAREYGRLDILINNAGLHYDTFQNTLTADFAIVEEAIQVNTLGPWRMAQAFSELLLKSPAGRIVNVSSASGSFVDSWPGTPAYALSKAGLNMLTLKMAQDLTDTDILVNAVCPGWVRTDMGGAEAPRDVREGAAGIVWAAWLPAGGPSGGFFRDGEVIPW